MAMSIEELLHRRNDLSTFLVHLTRDGGGQSALQNLISMLSSNVIEARNVYGMGRTMSHNNPAFAESQRVVCFTETPLEHAWIMCQEIENRAFQFGPYGIAFTKTWARREGVNPVWYIDITVG